MTELLRKILFTVSALLLTFMVGSLFLQVLAREFRWAVDWTEESARFTFIAMVFIAAAYATLTESNLRVTVFTNWLAGRIGQKPITIVHSLILIAFGCVMVYYSIVNFQEGMQYPNISPAIGFNQNYLFIFMIFGFVVITALQIAALFSILRSPKVGESHE